jgi:hypothetical protein
MTDDEKLRYSQRVLHNIKKRIEHAHEHEDYDSVYVDLLAIIQYIKRELTLLEGSPPSNDD